jgi:hypothetical protein
MSARYEVSANDCRERPGKATLSMAILGQEAA